VIKLIRILLLPVLTVLFSFQTATQPVESRYGVPPVPMKEKKDSTTTAHRKPIKEVKSNKTKIHHVKKVENSNNKPGN